MKELLSSMEKYFSEKNRGYYVDWGIGYCGNCSAIVFVTGESYVEYLGEDCLGSHYGHGHAGARHCSECQSIKYTSLEDLLTNDERLPVETILIFDRALEKLRSDKFVSETLFNLYDKDGLFKQEIDKWLGLPKEEKVATLQQQRKIKQTIKEARELESKYAINLHFS